MKKKTVSILAGLTLGILSATSSACEISSKDTDLTVMTNDKGEAFGLASRQYARYDTILDTYDLSTCKKISSGVALKSNVREVLEKNGFRDSVKINTNNESAVNLSQNLRFMFNVSHANDKFSYARTVISDADVRRLQAIKSLFAGDISGYQPNTVESLENPKTLQTPEFWGQFNAQVAQVKPIAFKDVVAWAKYADGVRNAFDRTPILQTKLESAIFPKTGDISYFQKLLPKINNVDTLDNAFTAVQNHYNSLDSSAGQGAAQRYSVLYMTDLSRLASTEAPKIITALNADQTDLEQLYAKAVQWQTISAQTKSTPLDVTSKVVDLFFSTTAQKQRNADFEQNPQPYLTGNLQLIPSSGFNPAKKAEVRVHSYENSGSFGMNVYTKSGNDALIIANITLPKKCTPTDGKEYSRNNTESDGSIMQSFYKKQTTICTLPYGITSRDGLEALIKGFANRNQLTVITPSYQYTNDFLARSEEVHVRTTQIGVNQQVRAEHNIRQQARQQCRQQQTMCYAQCQGMSDIGDQDYQGFFSGFQSSPKSRCRDTCNNMCN